MARRAIVQKDTVFKFDTQRAIVPKDTVPKDTVPKFGTQKVVVPKDPSDRKIPYPKIPYPNLIDSDGSQFNFDTAIEDKPMGKSMDAMEVDEQESDGDDKKELQAAFAAGLLKDGLKK
uniref:Uncharacterized protein n=1 Tax=Caenorhabditis japonica TaxID=281687 RepID=A0A8R1ECV8_CAEJA